MKKAISDKSLPAWQGEELATLAALPENAIDTSDAAEITDWTGARRGLLTEAAKESVRLELDSDVVAWFKATSPGRKSFKAGINQALREYIDARGRKVG
jgi:uncharacterized protein (DUF4415 family)